MIERKRLGIPIVAHINESDVDFKIEGEGIGVWSNSIKFISDKLAERFIAQRPYKNYKEIEELVWTKGAGLNSRALASLRAVGAANFPDRFTEEDEVRSNLYEFLNLPEFSYDIPAQYLGYITEAADYDEQGAFVMLGMVRSVKRGKGWSRVDVLDKTGAVGIFDKESTELETGKTYLLLVNNNRIVKHIPADQIKNDESGLTKFMNYKTLPFDKDQYFVVNFRKRKTKAGKTMADMVLANTERELASVVVFPSQYGEAYIKLNEGSAHNIVLGESKGGGLVYKSVR